jgi:hypothetical protein
MKGPEAKKFVAEQRKKEAAPIFEKAMATARRAGGWLVMEVLARAFNEEDAEVWNLNAFAFIGNTEHWVRQIADEKGLLNKEVYVLQRNLNLYEKGFANIDEYAAVNAP